MFAVGAPFNLAYIWFDYAAEYRLQPDYFLRVCVYVVQLVTGGDADAVALTEAYDWYFLPVVNPDGYAYTWTTVSHSI